MTERVAVPKGRNENRITGGSHSMDMPYEFKFMAIITTPASTLITTDGWSVDVRNTPAPFGVGMRPSWSLMPMFASDDDGQPAMDIHVYLPFTPDVRQFLKTLEESLRNGETQIDLWVIVPMKSPTPDDERTMVLQNRNYQPGPQSELDDSEWRRQLTQDAADDARIATARILIRCARPVPYNERHAPAKTWISGEMGDFPKAVRDYYNLHDTRDEKHQ